MSSPARRRQPGSSQSSTPRRTSQRNAIPSSTPDPAAAQLQNEAASSQGRAPPLSSPMKYRSSPADIARMNREREISSPLRQMSNTQTTNDDDGSRTPRATTSGLIGGT
jgi:DNA replication licensing factor MCM4